MLEELYEVRVVAVVVDDEAGIDRNISGATRRQHRVGVTACAIFRFVEDDIHGLGKEPGTGEARYS